MDLLGLQANTTTLFYRKLRVIIAEKLEHEASKLAGEIESDERYSGGVRKGKRPLFEISLSRLLLPRHSFARVFPSQLTWTNVGSS